MTVAVDAVVYHRISDPKAAVVNVIDVNGSTRQLAQTTLRNILGTKTLSEILAEKESIALNMKVDKIFIQKSKKLVF